MSLVKKIGTAADVFKKDGVRGVVRKSRQLFRRMNTRRRARIWLKHRGVPTPAELDAMRQNIAAFPRRPLISVVMPVYNVDEIWLRTCIESVRQQVYQKWELCIADDFSPAAHVRAVLNEYAGLDPRIKVVYREANGHISAASNTALSIAAGEFCVLLDHDDELSADALYWIANEIIDQPDVAMIYSDDDMIDAKGRRYAPNFKPDFSRDLLYSLNLVTHLSAYRTDILRSIGGFRLGFEGSQDYDLALRFIEQISEEQIRHVPRILYHWRAIPGSVAMSGDEKPYAHDRARLAIKEHLERRGIAARVEPTAFNLHRVRYELPAELPTVSLILFGSGAGDALISTPYPVIEILHANIENGVAGGLNTAVQTAKGSVLCFVDASLEPKSGDWLQELVSVAVQENVGAVGGQVMGRDGRVVEGGIVFGGDAVCSAANHGFYFDEAGNAARNIVIGNFSAVSLACMAVARRAFDRIGGFDTEMPDALVGADLCLRLRAAGCRIVLDPYAEMVLAKGSSLSRSAATGQDRRAFVSKWKSVIERDPFGNPNLEADGQFRIRL